ncbi:MAG: hypothetical protein KatS3mg115_1024 [Candidatus Poribacteria bacterium]|nr:MAG: hypothetical protein KatS3mg115_1024 [Candidatus Poribacteria bacterium]
MINARASLVWMVLGLSTTVGGERTLFQTGHEWIPELDLRSDVAIVYGVNESFPSRVESWRQRGYTVHMMTGVAWGEYREYLDGAFDGQSHWEEAQTLRDGTKLMHGGGVPYLVPTPSYTEYLKTLVRWAIDQGVEAVHLEEPEFWARAGYSPAFQRAWQQYYGRAWEPPHRRPEAAFWAAQLKARLYLETLESIFQDVKKYSGGVVRCIVPTHTLVNYASWRIVSPESQLAGLKVVNGIIAQVWTGTARTPNRYRGVRRSRTYETALLEYHSAVALFEPAGKTLYFLTDPIEDDPNHTWSDYRRNYEATYAAQLAFPSVNRYEVMPWPNRVFRGRYPADASGERVPIPPEYATEVLVLVNALNHIPRETGWLQRRPIGLVVSDTLMYQRGEEDFGAPDPELSNFFGLAMPLVKRALPFRMICLEHLGRWERLEGIRLLLLSYAAMKPLSPEAHQYLADWVRKGGVLLYVGRDDDPYQRIPFWWSEKGSATPLADLLTRLGLKDDSEPGAVRWHSAGEGSVGIWRVNPRELAEHPEGDWFLQAQLDEGLRRARAPIPIPRHVMHIVRGPYEVVAVLDESVSAEPYRVPGLYVDLFDPSLPIVRERFLSPGEQAVLLAVERWPLEESWVLAAASRASEERREEGTYSVLLRGPAGTQGIARIWLPRSPQTVESSAPLSLQDYDPASRTLRIAYPNSPEGVRVSVRY